MAFSLANVWLCYRLGVSIFGGQAIGVLAAYLLAISRLHVRLGSTELPRTVSTTFVLLAFAWLRAGRGRGRAVLAGLALGVAGSRRFSEAVFAIPVALQLAMERRYRDLLVAGATALLAVGFLLGPETCSSGRRCSLACATSWNSPSSEGSPLVALNRSALHPDRAMVE